MEKLLLLIIVTLSFAFGSEERGLFLTYRLEKSTHDVTLSADEAIFKFSFDNFNDSSSNRIIIYSIDNIQDTVQLTEGKYFEITTTPGVHAFKFFYDEFHYEVKIDSLNIKSQHRDDYRIYLEDSRFPIVVDKPVIYLYPESEIDVRVKLDVHGESLFTYPKYENGWEFKATSNGDLKFGDATYNYLFWEASTHSTVLPKEILDGFVVARNKTVAFLEAKLTEAGLNSKEQADFITYWAPRMMQNESNYVRFEFNDECNHYAELEISPKPDNLYRIFMTWSEMKPHSKITPQEIIPMKRDGFTVIEWGGTQIIELKLPR